MKEAARRILRYRGFGTMTALCLAFLYGPLVGVAVYSFNASRSISQWGGFSLDWYARALTNPVLRDAAFNSLVVAMSAASLATILATLAALGLGRGAPLRGQTALTAAISLPLMVPEVITAIASLVFFVTIGIPLGFTAIIFAHTVFCIPFAYLPISARLTTISEELGAAASDLYAEPSVVVRTIYLPLLAPGIVAGFCLAFIVSLDDFVIANFLTGPGTATLPVAIYGMSRIGFTPEINAVATVMLAISITFVATAILIGWRGRAVGAKHS